MLIMYTSKGNGLGTCVLCNNKIKKGEKQFVVEGYRQSCRAHLKCIKSIINETSTAEQLNQENCQ